MVHYMGNYKHPNDQKTSVITVRMTVEERERLTKLATKARLNVSDFIRKLIRELPLRRKGKGDEAVPIG